MKIIHSQQSGVWSTEHSMLDSGIVRHAEHDHGTTVVPFCHLLADRLLLYPPHDV